MLDQAAAQHNALLGHGNTGEAKMDSGIAWEVGADVPWAPH